MTERDIADICKMNNSTMRVRVLLKYNIENYFKKKFGNTQVSVLLCIVSVLNTFFFQSQNSDSQTENPFTPVTHSLLSKSNAVSQSISTCCESNVLQIIKNSPKGNLLLDLKKLNDSSRSQLVENLVNYFIDHKIALDKPHFEKIAYEIVLLFPNECSVKKKYFKVLIYF